MNSSGNNTPQNPGSLPGTGFELFGLDLQWWFMIGVSLVLLGLLVRNWVREGSL